MENIDNIAIEKVIEESRYNLKNNNMKDSK